MLIGRGHPILRDFFYSYGRLVARHPRAVLFLSIGVFFTTLYGLFNFSRVNDLEYLYSPMNAPSKAERKRFNDVFPEEADEHYSFLRSTDVGEFLTLFATAVGDNILTPEAIADVRELDKAVRAVKSTQYRADASTKIYVYEDICCIDNGACVPDPVLTLLKFCDASKIHFPVHQINVSGSLIDVFLGYSLGGVTIKEGTTVAKAWMMRYSLLPDHPMSMQWQREAMAAVEQLKFEHITVSRHTARSIRDELHEVAKRISPLFIVSFFILIIFSAASLMTTDWLQSKPQLAVAGVVSSCLAIPSAFGVCSQFGIPAADIVAASPFLIVGVGVDDTFVMTAAWRQTDHRLTVEDRMGHAFADAALAVTVTSIADILSIAVGAFAEFHSVQIFCAFTGAGIAFDFFYQLTFLGACMVFAGRREAASRHPVACSTVVPLSMAKDRGTLFRWFCTGGALEDETRSVPATITFFRYTCVDLLNNTIVKTVIFVLYAVYLGVAIWGCTNVREGLHLSKLATDGSYVNDFYDVKDIYFTEFDLPLSVLVEGRIEPWQPQHWQYMEKVLDSYEQHSEFFHGANLSVAWTRRFVDQFGIIEDKENFIRAYKAFIRRPNNHQFDLDVKWEHGMAAMTATRFHFICKEVGTSTRETAMMQLSRKVAAEVEQTGFVVTAFHPLFLFFDKYAVVVPTTLRNLALAMAAMMVVSLVLIPSLACCLSVTLSIASICTGVVGYMTWWGVNMDSISMTNIIMCIGFSVDYSAHITIAFVTASGTDKVERMRNAFAMVGFPIVQCAVSSILSVSLLASARGYMLRAFFKIMFLVIVFGAFHGLLVIPEVLLAIGGGVLKYQRYVLRKKVNPTLPKGILDKLHLTSVDETGDTPKCSDTAFRVVSPQHSATNERHSISPRPTSPRHSTRPPHHINPQQAASPTHSVNP